MIAENPIQLSLIPAHLEAPQDESELVGLWLGGERWLRSHGRLISAFVFFHFKEGGEAVISIRAEDQRVPHRVYGRWWVEGDDLVVALGGGDIRAPYSVASSILYWAEEVLVRRPMCVRKDRAAAEEAARLKASADVESLVVADLAARLAD